MAHMTDDARETLREVAADSTQPAETRVTAANSLLHDVRAWSTMQKPQIITERWYDASTRDMTSFFLRLLASLVPAGVAGFVLYVILYLSAAVLTNLVQ